MVEPEVVLNIPIYTEITHTPTEINLFIGSLPFYLLCQFLKSEADIVEVTVVFIEEKSVRRVHLSTPPYTPHNLQSS